MPPTETPASLRQRFANPAPLDVPHLPLALDTPASAWVAIGLAMAGIAFALLAGGVLLVWLSLPLAALLGWGILSLRRNQRRVAKVADGSSRRGVFFFEEHIIVAEDRIDVIHRSDLALISRRDQGPTQVRWVLVTHGRDLTTVPNGVQRARINAWLEQETPHE